MLLTLMLSAAALYLTPATSRAADHGDAPNVAGDQACDIADVYFFLDPNNNNKVVLIGTFRGFIVPGEAVNFGIFDPNVRYRFEIENTGDARPDAFVDVTFDKRAADPGPPPKQILQVPRAQTATVRLPNGATFTAPVFNPSLGSSPPPQMVTYNAGDTGVDFFAGEVDDPFFFDLPAFGRFIASVRNGSPDPSLLMRGRDTFAGYNILSIALRFPVSMLRGTGNIVGVDFLSQRATQEIQDNGRITRSGPFHTLDRMGNPAVNVALVPFNRKDEYNAATTQDDANGQFAAAIVATLQALGTNASNINTLAEVAVLHGDFLHLNVSVPNSGAGGGHNAAASFPNGRRLRDDVIDILLNIITNGAIVTGDNVNANDVPFGNTFPFLAPPHQPLATGVIDDKTRN
ncbi:MAG TPA: DUF4331 family protein [Candidatus Udaeobacter sp.]|jgi:hypothetical protein